MERVRRVGPPRYPCGPAVTFPSPGSVGEVMARIPGRFFALAAARGVLALAVAVSSGCGARTGAGAPTGPPTGSPAREVADSVGRLVRVPERPERVITLAPSLTEVVFALDAGDRLVADTSFCDYPPEATAKPHIGDTQHPDLERIVALKPDLVLLSTASQLEETVARLDRVGIPVFVTEERDLDGVLAGIERLGDLLGEPAKGRALATRLRDRTSAVRERVANRPVPRVFFMVGDRPLFTAGRGTFVNDLILRAGGRSISGDETADWPTYSPEAVIARAPDIIVIPVATHGIAAEGMALPEMLRETPAARAGRVVRIDADLLMRPGPRLVDGLEQLARLFHPEVSP
jgi:iron complex transport system substrate-binding protein